MTTSDSRPGPYAHTAHAYKHAGWDGPIPLPAGAKHPPPTGWTGADGDWPSGADIQAWVDNPSPREGGGNIALRLPDGIIGLDVDAYDHKPGAHTITTAEHTHGPLPPSWSTTARYDDISGIRIYQTPTGLAWPGELGPGVEIIQHRHRYAMVWPSVHPTAGTYHWNTPTGTITTDIPHPDTLPQLPTQWVDALTHGTAQVAASRAGLTDAQSAGWLSVHGGGQPCPAVQRYTTRATTALTTGGGSRHDTTLTATRRLTALAADGHTGVLIALEQLHETWVRVAEADPARAGDPHEWARMLIGAADLAAAADYVNPVDPCIDPFAGIIHTTTVTSASTFNLSPTTPTPDVDLALVALRQEIERQRAQRGARRHLDDEDAAAAFTQPQWATTLTAELAIPDTPIPYTIEDVLPDGANVLLTAQYKAGKTTLMNNLTRALADRTPFLGRFDVTTGRRVGIFNYEVTRAQYRRWLRDTGITNTDQVTVLNLRGYRMPLVTAHTEQWITQWLREHRIDTWIIDPFARAFVGSGSSENDNTEVGRFLDTLDIIKHNAGVSELIMVAHTGRATHEIGEERARGATRLDDWADVRWLLNSNGDGERFFRANGRDVDVKEGQLHYSTIGRLLTFNDGGRKRVSAATLTASILTIITAQPGINGNEILAALKAAGAGGKYEKVLADIMALINAGRVRREKAGKSFLHYLADVSDLLIPPGTDTDQSFPASFPSPFPTLSRAVSSIVSPGTPLGPGNDTFPDPGNGSPKDHVWQHSDDDGVDRLINRATGEIVHTRPSTQPKRSAPFPPPEQP